MEHIIQQIMQEMIEEVLREIGHLPNIGLGKVAERLHTVVKEYLREVLKVALDVMDQALVDAKNERKKDGYSIHERGVKRTLYTDIGAVQYSRTYFKSVKDECNIYLLDHIVGVEEYDRVDASVSAKLVQEASSCSYDKSARLVCDNELSRQTVRNKLMKTSELAYIPEKREHTPEEIHIFADEDHVAMQDGKNHNVNLITLSEGIREVCKGRNELINPVHIQGYKIPPENHWEYAAAIIKEMYNPDEIKRIYIHGDGASWIKSGEDVLARSRHVLDGYHYNKTMRKLCAGDFGANYAAKLYGAVKRHDPGEFSSVIDIMISWLEKKNADGDFDKKIKSVRVAGDYILSNWDAIQRRHIPGMPGSCTEPMVSHVLSERLSRSPMGWSEAGLSKMSSLRVFVANGQVVNEEHIRGNAVRKDKKAPREIVEYRRLVQTQQEGFLKGRRDWSIFENASFSMGLVTGTKKAYDALSEMRSIAS